MAQFSKVILSGSTNGGGVNINATSTTGDNIHTASTVIDEVWLWAWNTSASADVTLTLEFGGVSVTVNTIEVQVPYLDKGLICVVPGLPLSGSLSVAGFASVADSITVFGYVNRIT